MAGRRRAVAAARLHDPGHGLQIESRLQAEDHAFHHRQRVHRRHHVVDGFDRIAGAGFTDVIDVRADGTQDRTNPLEDRRVTAGIMWAVRREALIKD